MSGQRKSAATESSGGAVSLLSDDDLFLFNEGTHTRLWERLGAHPQRARGVDGTFFAVWAPNARSVSVIGDFNGWDPRAHPLSPRGAWTTIASILPSCEQARPQAFTSRLMRAGLAASLLLSDGSPAVPDMGRTMIAVEMNASVRSIDREVDTSASVNSWGGLFADERLAPRI